MSKVVFKENEDESKTVEIIRVQYSIEYKMSLDNDYSRLYDGVIVSVSGKMKRTEVNNRGVWTYKDNIIKRGSVGKLSFKDDDDTEYYSIDNVFVIDVSENGETWREWGDIEIKFSNEGVDFYELGLVTFSDGTSSIDIYNSSLTISPSYLRRDFKTTKENDGSFITKNGYSLVRATLSGIIPYDSCEFPDSIISIFEQFEDKAHLGKSGKVPKERKLTEYLTNLTGIDYEKMIIESANLTWSIEKKTISVSVSFIGPNQKTKESEV